jgi:hypothetical protein
MQDSGLSFIPLSSFEFQKENAKLLPLSFAASRGALVFELMGDDALVLCSTRTTPNSARKSSAPSQGLPFLHRYRRGVRRFSEKIRKSLAETTK